MSYYMFKLNLSYSILSAFDNKKDREYLIETEIPHVLQTIYDYEEDKPKQGFLKLYFEQDVVEDFKEEFDILKKLTKDLLHSYEEVIRNYNEEGSVVYPKEFLRLTSKCGRLRNKLLNKYPVIKSAEEYSDNVVIEENNIPIEHRVGTGIFHLKQFYKIDKFIKNHGYDIVSNKTDTYYNIENEFIIIRSDSEDEALAHSNWLESDLNTTKTFTEKFRKVTILPIYKEFKIKGELKRISFTAVYPNGTSSDINDLIEKQLDKTGSDEVETTLKSGTRLDDQGINKMLSTLASKGYLKAVEDKKDKIIKKIKTISL